MIRNARIMNAAPIKKVSLLMNSSIPLSFWAWNNSEFPPVIICPAPASEALFPCKSTKAIKITDNINSANSMYFT